MKRLFLAIAASIVCVGSTFAATPTTEPKLPADIDSWTVVSRDACNKHTGKSILVTLYSRSDEGFLKQIRVMTLNGQKIYQVEYSRKLNDNPPKGFSYIYYVRNSPAKNWFAYEWDEVAQGDARTKDELGLRTEQSPC
ncbi:MAG: hypothetical protein Q7S52_02785 [bacterium]|nr:hypothetical protein [bacterium]